MKPTINITILFLLLIATGCTGSGNKADNTAFCDTLYMPEYASGFIITGCGNESESVMLTVNNPWQGADSIVTKLLILRGDENVPKDFDGKVLHGNASRIVTMSTSHIAMLDAIDKTESIVGVSGKGYVSNEKIRERSDVGDVGFDGNINYETLIALNPDLVLLYGVTGENSMTGKLDELDIPYIYIGEYLEESPLGKAEWVVALSELTGNRQKGIDVFTAISSRYNELKDKIESSFNMSQRPAIMVNTPYGDSWFMPSTRNYMSRLIEDAGGNYVYRENNSGSSVPIDMETAYVLTSMSDIWINTGTANSLEELKAVCPKYTDTRPFMTGKIYNNTLRTSTDGGNDFWESGVMNPDEVLSDLIRIFHPEVNPDYELKYYKKLQ